MAAPGEGPKDWREKALGPAACSSLSQEPGEIGVHEGKEAAARPGPS